MSDSARVSIIDDIKMGLGTWSWGDKYYWGFGNGYSETDIQEAFNVSMDAGIRLIDTAEVYGLGRSEQFIGELIKQQNAKNVIIASKFMPFPWRLSRKSFIKALKKSLNRLGIPAIDLYQIHFPWPPVTVETWMEAMVDAYQRGLIKGVGVSNYDRSQTMRAGNILIREGIHLESNQVEYNLLNRKIEDNGLLAECISTGIKVIAYSPLAMGILTGKYTPEHQPSGMRGRRYNRKYLEKVKPLIDALIKIGNDHSGKTASQVALNWVICKGAIVIPGAKRASQAEQNAGALGWELIPDEVEKLDDISKRVTRE